jgi:hypothetical protein
MAASSPVLSYHTALLGQTKASRLQSAKQIHVGGERKKNPFLFKVLFLYCNMLFVSF